MATILIAEDRDINIMLLKAMIADIFPDVQILVAENGQQALEQAQQASPDLILMDVNMPVMDGLEASRKIREIESGTDRKVPILALTAASYDDEMIKFKEAGMNDFIPKPIMMEDLQAKVTQYLPD